MYITVHATRVGIPHCYPGRYPSLLPGWVCTPLMMPGWVCIPLMMPGWGMCTTVVYARVGYVHNGGICPGWYTSGCCYSRFGYTSGCCYSRFGRMLPVPKPFFGRIWENVPIRASNLSPFCQECCPVSPVLSRTVNPAQTPFLHV